MFLLNYIQLRQFIIEVTFDGQIFLVICERSKEFTVHSLDLNLNVLTTQLLVEDFNIFRYDFIFFNIDLFFNNVNKIM